MSPRTRTVAVVASLAALAAVVVAGSAALSSDDPGPAAAPVAPTPRQGAPPLVLDLALRDDRRAEELRRATNLYRAGRRLEAHAIFSQDDSLEAKLGAALSGWPETLDRIEQLGALYPRSGLVQLHVGLARYWAGERGALDAWREARDVEPNSTYAVKAGDLLHPELAPGLPRFVPNFAVRRVVRPGFTVAHYLDVAGNLGLHDLLTLGAELQSLGYSVSARRVYARAALLAPNDPEALVADAVGRYSKESQVEAFSRLGPLSRRFPKAATVRFHLGLLLLWQGDVAEARKQLRQARALQPGSRIATEAGRYLNELAKVGTG